MKAACVIPHYNHSGTLAAVALECKKYLDMVLVVDDGSDDFPEAVANQLTSGGVELIRLERNRGKGFALKTAAKLLAKRSVDYMITLDADGQHDAADIPKFLEILNERQDCVIIGCRNFDVPNVPKSSRFGRKFSNFWVKLETGVTCGDTQSGFRAYPVAALNTLHLRCNRYNFEIEVLVKLLWSGFEVVDLPVAVTYLPGRERISHFRKGMDNVRLSLLHTALVLRQLIFIPHRKLVRRKPEFELKQLLHPGKLMREAFMENSSPEMLAASAALGAFLAVLPLYSMHTAIVLYISVRLKLNKILILAIQSLFMPPLSPFICIELGYFMRHGTWLAEMDWRNWSVELHLRLWEWLLGSIILAPVAAVICYFTVYGVAKRIQKRTAK